MRSVSASPDLDSMKGRLRLFLTTYGEGRRSGTVPVFFLAHEGKVYFTTRKTTRKAVNKIHCHTLAPPQMLKDFCLDCLTV